MKNQKRKLLRGRPKKPRCICYFPEITYFKPAGVPLRSLNEELLMFEELEAIRLKDQLGLDQEQSAKKMKISRITFLRILKNAHKKIANALIYGKAIKMEGGDYVMPNLDGTGPQGQGPMTGRGQGKARMGGSSDCECPNCNCKVPHKRGVPCRETKCPKCGTPMRGVFCR